MVREVVDALHGDGLGGRRAAGGGGEEAAGGGGRRTLEPSVYARQTKFSRGDLMTEIYRVLLRL